MNNITDKIKQFSQFYKYEVSQKYSGELDSYKLLVDELPKDIGSFIKELGGNLKVTGSIGKGNNTYYPWIGIFDSRVSTGATNGFYVVLLFSDDFEDLYLTLNQGSTQQSKEQTETYKGFVYSNYESVEGFIKGRIPSGGLVKTKSGSTAEKGRKYEDTNIFYKNYKISFLSEEQFGSDLKKIVQVYLDCASKYFPSEAIITSKDYPKKSTMDFEYQLFFINAKEGNLKINQSLALRFIASLLTKPFVILTGLSGSGKTKLAQSFAMWICEDESQYCIVPVGADWTNREPLLGFPNALDKEQYVKPDNRTLDLIIEANKSENALKPFFLILDEMNLSHVERYFADFLSVMESKDKISLHSGNCKDVPMELRFPRNLFIVGTVNIDETTYMFSPKVLDRANVIEFTVTKKEMEDYLKKFATLNLEAIESLGANMAESFLQIAKNDNFQLIDNELNTILLNFFSELKKTRAEFGYRTASEILRFAAITKQIEASWKLWDVMDAAIMQKLLPKVHGSRRKLEPVLKTLGTLCLQDGEKFENYLKKEVEIDFADATKIKYPLSFEKLLRMYDNLISNGFTSYAEA